MRVPACRLPTWDRQEFYSREQLAMLLISVLYRGARDYNDLKVEYVAWKEGIRVLSKIIPYLLQDGCVLKVRTSDSCHR